MRLSGGREGEGGGQKREKIVILFLLSRRGKEGESIGRVHISKSRREGEEGQ